MSSCSSVPTQKEKKWGVKDCRARKCPDLRKDTTGPFPEDSPERCYALGEDHHSMMPGTLSCCIKDLDGMKPEEFLRHVVWSLRDSWEKKFTGNRKTPGVRNCPAGCPFKISEEGEVRDRSNKDDYYAMKKGLIWKCAFSGAELGSGLAASCPCHVLDNPDQEKYLRDLRTTIEIYQRVDFDYKHLDVRCATCSCPDGIHRCKDWKTCPVIKLPIADIKECPLWRIPAKLLQAPAIETPAKPTPEPEQNTENKPAPESPAERLARGKAIREEVGENREAMKRVMSGKSSVKKAKKEKPEPPALNVLYLEDCEKLSKRMEPESVDLIFTDPPYVTEPIVDEVTQWERAYVALHLIASRVLKPSGFLITYAPQAHLLDIMEILAYGSSWNINVQETGGRLDYFWIIPSINGGATCKAHKWNALCLHKPILVFQKAPFKSPSKCFADVVRGKKQKSYHAWQQSVHDVLGILSRFMEPGQVLFDPYACTGTTLIAGQLLGMKWIGAEIDPAAHAIGVRELQQRPMDLFTFGGEQPEPPQVREVIEAPKDTSKQAAIGDPALEARPVECKIQDLVKEEPAAPKEPLCYCTPCKTWATCTAKPESKECQAHRKLKEDIPEGGCTNCGHHKTKKTFKESCTRLKDLLLKGGQYSAVRLMAEVAADGCLGWIPKNEEPEKVPEPVEEDKAPPKKKPERDTPEWFEALTEAKRRNNPGWIWEVWKHSEKGEWLYEGADTYPGAVDIKDRLDKTLPESHPGKHSPVHFTLRPRPKPDYPADEIEGPCKVCKIECIDENGADGCWEFEEHSRKLDGEGGPASPRWGYREICIISCGKVKIWDEPAKGKKIPPARVCARNAYTGPLFTLARKYAEHEYKGPEYYILSDKYGLIRPGDEIENYDVSPEDIEKDAEFLDMVQQRAKADPDLAMVEKITVICGEIHQRIIEKAFPGVEIVNPVQGLPQGKRMQALKALVETPEGKTPSVPVDAAPAEKEKPNCGGKRPAISRCPDNCPDRSIEKEGGYPQGRCKQTGEKLREMQTCPNDPPKAEKKPGKKTEKPIESVVPFRQFLNEHHEQIVTGKDLPIVPHVVEQYKRFDSKPAPVKLFIGLKNQWWTLTPSGKLRKVSKRTGQHCQGESFPDCKFVFEWHYADNKKED